MKAKKAIKKSFLAQLNQEGFSMVELLSMCPTIWKMPPVQATRFIEQEMMKTFPVGVVKDIKKEVP